MDKKIDEYEETEGGHKRVKDAADYILSNWTAARIRVQKWEGVCGCSAEGHVSHVLSSRMSSRPMGWSNTGVAKMSELRAYYYNKKDMLELVRYQKEELPKVVGMEYPEITLKQILESERKQRSGLGKYMESIREERPAHNLTYTNSRQEVGTNDAETKENAVEGLLDLKWGKTEEDIDSLVVNDMQIFFIATSGDSRRTFTVLQDIGLPNFVWIEITTYDVETDTGKFLEQFLLNDNYTLEQ